MKSINFLEENGVDVKKSLELFGDVNTYNETIGEFLVGIHTKINQLIHFLENKDMPNYAIYVHSMKGDAKNFGFTKLADCAFVHEQKSKENDYSYIRSHINDLINLTNEAIILIQEYMSGGDEYQLDNNIKQYEFNQKTILVVDDSNIIRNFVKRVFSEEYNVATAEDGMEAIQIIKANQNNDYIEAILLDLNMPKVDGFAVLDYMKENKLLKKMPVSIISGDSSKETIEKAFTYGIVDMLEKPFNNQSVKMVVEKTIYYRNI